MSNSWYNFLQEQGAVFGDSSVLRFGNGKSTYLDTKDTVFSPVVWMSVARISGADAFDFLQAQLTADVRDIGRGLSKVSGYCNPKGRLLAIFRILRDGDDFLLLSDSGILPHIIQRLQMYVLRMKVALTIESERVAIGLTGPKANFIAAQLAAGLSEITNEVLCNRGMCVIPIGDREKGYLVIATPTQLIKSWSTIKDYTKLAGSDQWALFEMRSGLPRITTSTQENFIPQSVNLDLIGGVSFNKGCYPGQEIVARVRYLGRLKHRMARALITHGGLPNPGDPIFSDPKAVQRVGTVINVVGHPNGTGELLATVPLASSPDTELPIDQEGRYIRLVEMPVVSSQVKSN
jgi:hypothetical protein